MNTTQIKLIADEDLPGCSVVLAADGRILGHGDTKAEALTTARPAVLERAEARRFRRFAGVVGAAITTARAEVV